MSRAVLPAQHRAYPWLALVAGLVMLARSASTVTTFSATTDEPAHLASAVSLYETGKLIYMVEHPPLQRLVVGGALRLFGVRDIEVRDYFQMNTRAIQPRQFANEVGARILFDQPAGYWKVLAIARLANLIFPAIALLYVYLLGKYLVDSRVGMLAVVFFSLDPALLAHSALAGTDVAAAAGFLAATYHGLRFVASPTWKHTLIAGLALGLSIACKFSVLFLLPALAVLVIARSIRLAMLRPLGMGRLRAFFARWPNVLQLLTVCAIAFFVLWATYLFNVDPISMQEQFDQERTWHKIPQWAKDINVPMPSAILGNMFLLTLSKHGFRCYFNGQVTMGGDRLYFPETIAIKSPLGMLIALALAIGVFLLVRKSRRPWIAAAVVLPSSILLIFSTLGKLQIGIRHVMPVLPFMYLFAVVFLARGRWIYALLPLMLVTAVETAAIHPDYLAFFNQSIGGPKNGWKYLGDSNLDWGQDVARMADYLKAQDKPYVVYVSGGAHLRKFYKYVGLRPANLPADPTDESKMPDQLAEAAKLRANPHGLLALSIDTLLRVENIKKNDDGTFILGPDYTWARDYTVVKHIGESIRVYDLDQPLGRANNPTTHAAKGLP